MEPTLLFVITAAMFVVVGAAVVIGHYYSIGKKKYKSPYSKKPGFFESSGELNLFNTLTQVCGDRYHVFPYVHLGRLLEVKKTVDWKETSNYRSRIDRKPADFVICNRTGEALAVIELSGNNHNFPDKKSLDKFVEDLSQVEGLPLVHLAPSMSSEAVRAELNKVLPV